FRSVPSGGWAASGQRRASVTTWERRPIRLTVSDFPQLRFAAMEGSKTSSSVQCHLTEMTSLATPVDDLGTVGGLPVCANVPFAVEVTVSSVDCDLECIDIADIDVRQQTDDALCGAFVAQFVQIEHRDLRVERGEVLAHTGMCGEDEFESADVVVSEIGRASCRERGEAAVVALVWKKRRARE